MTIPMVVLAVLAVFAGYLNTPWFGTFLGDWLTEGNEVLVSHGHERFDLDYDLSNRRIPARYLHRLVDVWKKINFTRHQHAEPLWGAIQ